VQDLGLFQVFRTYTFDAADKSFHVLMLQSDWTRLQTVMMWFLWNSFMFTQRMALFPTCAASSWNIERMYESTVADSTVGPSECTMYQKLLFSE